VVSELGDVDTKFHVAVVLPAEERFDGTGGAVATWVREVYSRYQGGAVIFAPSSTNAFAGNLRLSKAGYYKLYDRSVRGLAMMLHSVLGRTWWELYVHALVSGKPWIRSLAPKLRRFEVVHIHNRPSYVIELRELKYQGRIILHMHNDLADYVKPKDFAGLLSCVDSFVFCSQYLASKAEADFGPMPYAVIYNGVDIGMTTVLPHAQRAALSLVFAGRIVPTKGADLAAEVCIRLNERGFPSTLNIFGGTSSGSVSPPTPYWRALAEKTVGANSRFGRQVIKLHGPVSHSEILKALGENAYFVYPCQWQEPFGMVVVEALAAGAFPVVSNVGGIPEIVTHGVDGILVDDFLDVEAFVSAIIELLPNDTVVWAERVQGRGMMTAQDRFSWDAVVHQLERVLSQWHEHRAR
jgi:lipopolysaccharide exporter